METGAPPNYSGLLKHLEDVTAEPSLSAPLIQSDLVPYRNQLEAIALLVSHTEEKAFSVFMDRIVSATDEHSAKDIEFYVFFNRHGFAPDIRPLKKLFRNVIVKNFQIPPEEDIYIRPGEPLPKKLPPLGAKSGPNTFFLSAMAELSQKKTALVLETDCYLGRNWLSKLKNHCAQSDSFWVSGAPYGGTYSLPDAPGLLTHLNGVALYATGSKGFQTFLACFRKFLVRFTLLMPEIAYDHGMRLFIDGNLRNQKASAQWEFIDRQFLKTELILNFSLPQDALVDAQSVLKKTSCAILHKKDPAQVGSVSGLTISRFPFSASFGVLDCYSSGNHLYFDLDPRTWIEKEDEEILNFFKTSVFKHLKISGAVVKRTLKYHAAIFIRVDKAQFKNGRSLPVGPETCVIREADSSSAFLQVASVVSSVSEAQSIIFHWEKSSALPDRFVFYFSNPDPQDLKDLKKDLKSKSASITTHFWPLPKMHKVSSHQIFKPGEKLDYLSIHTNSAYSHCLKYHSGAAWTLFVTPHDKLYPLKPTPELPSLFSVLRETSDTISVINLPVKLDENREKPLCLPIFRTSAHIFTACLNWAYATEEQQSLQPNFQIIRQKLAPEEATITIQLPSQGRPADLQRALQTLEAPLQANTKLRLQVVGEQIRYHSLVNDRRIHWLTSASGKYQAYNSPIYEKHDIVLLASDQIIWANPKLSEIVSSRLKQTFPLFDGVVAFRHPAQLHRIVLACGWAFLKARGFVFNPLLESNFGFETLLEDAQKSGKLKSVIEPIFLFQDRSLDLSDPSNLNRLADACHDKAVLRKNTELDLILSEKDGPFGLSQLDGEKILEIFNDAALELASAHAPNLTHSFSNSAGSLQWNRHRFEQVSAFKRLECSDSGVFFKLKMKFLVLLYFGGNWDERFTGDTTAIAGLIIRKNQRKKAGASILKVASGVAGHPILGFFLRELLSQRKHLSAERSIEKLETLVIKKALNKLQKIDSKSLCWSDNFSFSDKLSDLNTRNRESKNTTQPERQSRTPKVI